MAYNKKKGKYPAQPVPDAPLFERTANGKRTEPQRIYDRLRITSFLLQGFTHQWIGDKLKLSEPTVTKEIAIIKQHWVDHSVTNWNELRNQQLARIDVLELEAWAGYYRSLRPEEVETVQEARTEHDKMQVRTKEHSAVDRLNRLARKVRKERDGERGWLETVKWCISERNKMLGFYAPLVLSEEEIARMITQVRQSFAQGQQISILPRAQVGQAVIDVAPEQEAISE